MESHLQSPILFCSVRTSALSGSNFSVSCKQHAAACISPSFSSLPKVARKPLRLQYNTCKGSQYRIQCSALHCGAVRSCGVHGAQHIHYIAAWHVGPLVPCPPPARRSSCSNTGGGRWGGRLGRFGMRILPPCTPVASSHGCPGGEGRREGRKDRSKAESALYIEY